MVKVQIKSEKLTSFGGIFPIMEKFDRMLSCTIDSTLGLRSKVYGYQYSEIIRSLMCVYFCGGSCVEDVSSHLMENDYTSTDRDIVEYYNKRGGAERILDDMNNGFGWKRLPKSFMAENTVFLLLTALIRNFYRHLISDANMKSFGLKRTSRIKTFVFKYVSVPAKWVKTARQHILNIYTSNDAYMMAFKFDFG
mgnify:FL=1